METFSNNGSTTLNGAIDDNDNPITITAHTTFPQSGQFRIIIDNELLLVTAGAGSTSWTVTRGAEGSTAASHSNGATVTHILTAGSLAQFRADNVVADVQANRPTAGAVGRLFLPTDGLALQRDNGSTWATYGPLHKFTAPVDGDFSWVNQGGSTITDHGGALSLVGAADSVFQFRGRFKTAPSPPYTITIAFHALMLPGNNSYVSLSFRQSSNGRLHIFRYGFLNNTPTLQSSKYTSPTAINANYGSSLQGPVFGGGGAFMRIADDNTNRICSISSDGYNFTPIHTIGRTDFITADEVGFAVATNISRSPVMTITSWAEA